MRTLDTDLVLPPLPPSLLFPPSSWSCILLLPLHLVSSSSFQSSLLSLLFSSNVSRFLFFPSFLYPLSLRLLILLRLFFFLLPSFHPLSQCTIFLFLPFLPLSFPPLIISVPYFCPFISSSSSHFFLSPFLSSPLLFVLPSPSSHLAFSSLRFLFSPPPPLPQLSTLLSPRISHFKGTSRLNGTRDSTFHY